MPRSGREPYVRPELVAEFVDQRCELLPGEGTRQQARALNGQRLEANENDALRRWRRAQNAPTLWRVDEFLTRYEIHLNEFLAWCGERRPWLGPTPECELV